MASGFVEEGEGRKENFAGGATPEGESSKVTVKLPKMSMPKINLWIISTILLLVISIILFVRPQILGRAGATGATTDVDSTAVLTADQAGQKAVDYINNNLIQDATTASLDSVEEFSDDIYRVITIYQGTSINVYITKDGNWLFISDPFDTTASITTTTTTQQPSDEMLKSDRPEAHAFVMSYCPYGLQFLKAYVPVIELLGEKADVEVNFVNYAMHGETEVYENLKMYCIQKYQNDKFTDYLRCFVEAGDYEGCIDTVGIDTDALQTCMDDTDEYYQITEILNDQSSWGSSYPPFLIDNDLNIQYGVRGSPTFVLNGQILSVDRSPEAVKDAICSAFNTPPEECETELSSDTAAPSFGAIGSGTGASSSGQC